MRDNIRLTGRNNKEKEEDTVEKGAHLERFSRELEGRVL